MRVLYPDDNDKEIVLILNAKENDALAVIVGAYLTSKPNRQSNSFKFAKQLYDRLIA